MASRKSTRPVNDDDPAKWTVAKLKEELKLRGITSSASMPRKYLLQLLEQNPRQTVTRTETSPSTPCWTEVTNTIANLQSELADVRDSIATKGAGASSEGPITGRTVIDTTGSSYPKMHRVSQQIRQQIIQDSSLMVTGTGRLV